jgi:hypothetical protein
MLGHQSKPKLVSDNDVGWWCRDFYGLRSRIVHGDPLVKSDFLTKNVDKLKIALYLYVECVRGILAGVGIWTELERMKEFWLHRKWVDILGLPESSFF